MQVHPSTDYEFEGRFRLADVGADGRERTDDDTIYEGTFYASTADDGSIEAVLTTADGLVSDYATLEFTSDRELEGTVSIDGVEIPTKSERDCGKAPGNKPNRPEPRAATGTGRVVVESDGNSVRAGRDGVEIRSVDGTTVRADSQGVEIRREVRQEIRKALLTEALKIKIDARLAKMDEDVRAEFYPRVIDKIDTILDKLPDGKKKRLYTELRDYLETKWYEEFPQDAESGQEDVLDEVFSE